MLAPKLQPQEKAVADSLAVHHFAQHRHFPFCRRNLGPLAHAPRAGGLDAQPVRADIVGERSLAPLPARANRRREIHFHHNGESSFFPAVKAAIRAHSRTLCAKQLDFFCTTGLVDAEREASLS